MRYDGRRNVAPVRCNCAWIADVMNAPLEAVFCSSSDVTLHQHSQRSGRKKKQTKPKNRQSKGRGTHNWKEISLLILNLKISVWRKKKKKSGVERQGHLAEHAVGISVSDR